jgi:CelD/BcsL family acetyltransferase involved in cellulose biosynthesis
VEIDVLRPQFVPAEMVARWRVLQAAQPALDSPFLSPDWPRAVERAQGGADRGLRVAILHEGGRPRGFLAVRVAGATAIAPGAPLCGAQAIVAEAEAAAPDLRRLLKALGVGRFDFNCLLAGDETFAPHVRGEATAGVIDVSGGCTLEAAAEARAELERVAGGLIFTPMSRSKGDFDQMVLWDRACAEAAREPDVFQADWTLRLMKDLFASRDPDFGGALFTLHAGERLAAAAFALRGAGPSMHALVFASDPYFAACSPELALLGEITAWMAGSVYRRLELAADGYGFPAEVANASRALVYGFVGVPSPAALMRGAQYRLCETAESLPLGPFSRLPAEVMRRRDRLRGLR